jgi:hypothetical protein
VYYLNEPLYKNGSEFFIEFIGGFDVIVFDLIMVFLFLCIDENIIEVFLVERAKVRVDGEEFLLLGGWKFGSVEVRILRNYWNLLS